jgi:hypothetical protein
MRSASAGSGYKVISAADSAPASHSPRTRVSEHPELLRDPVTGLSRSPAENDICFRSYAICLCSRASHTRHANGEPEPQ